MSLSATTYMLADGGGKKRKSTTYQQQSNVQTPDLVKAKSNQDVWKDNLKTLKQRTQTAAVGSTQTPVYAQQQSNVQTSDLAYVKSNQSAWNENLKTLQKRTQTANYQQQSNVQTPDLVYAKSQLGWQPNYVPKPAEVQTNTVVTDYRALLSGDFELLAKQTVDNDPSWRFWQDPTMSNGVLNLSSTVDQNLVNHLKAECRKYGIDYEAELDRYIRAENQTRVQKQADWISQAGETHPGLASLWSVLLTPGKAVAGAQSMVSKAFGQKPDTNSAAYMMANAQTALRDPVRDNLAVKYGDAAAAGYDTVMEIFDSVYMAAMLGGGMIADSVEATNSAAAKYAALVAQGVSPKEAAARAGLTAGVELLVESGATEEMVGAAVRKTGLTDDLVKLGRKTPGGKEIIDAVEERLDEQMFKTGMELNGLNLTRKQEHDWIELNENVYGYSDEEVGQVAQHVASELTHVDTNATIESNNAVFLKSRNMKLEGERHPETNVPFERTFLELNGTKCETVEPKFDHAGQIQLDQDQHKASRRKQRKLSNTTLASDPLQQEQLKNVFTDSQIAAMKNGVTPSGYVWHHAATPGVMQLVRSDIHRKTGHTGGYSLWGLGADTGGH